MAIIYSYPKVTSPLATDVLVLTDTTLTAGKRKNKTKSLAMSDLAAYVVSSTSVITGGGALNTIPLWTPDGFKLGDSIMVQSTTQVGENPTIQVGTYPGPGQQTVLGAGFISTSGIGADQGSFTNITSGQTGVVTIQGNAIIGDQVTDTLIVNSTVTINNQLIDGTGSPGTAGQVISSDGGQIEWVDPSAAITKLIPYFQTATPGGSATYTQSNNIVDFDWSGGSGTYEYILPSATAIPYRKIRFVNNSTITASDKIHITAPGTETIDGGAFYEINKPYNGCAVWSDGVQWIVIQAKA